LKLRTRALDAWSLSIFIFRPTARDAVHPGTKSEESERDSEAFPHPRGVAVKGDGRAALAIGRTQHRRLACGQAAAWGSGCLMVLFVHAQSSRQIERCAELGRSRLKGSLLVPCAICTADRVLQATATSRFGGIRLSQGRVRRPHRAPEPDLNGWPFFCNWRRSLAASANSQSRKVTIFGRLAVAFGQMIQ
jgi:hypothetical protein